MQASLVRRLAASMLAQVRDAATMVRPSGSDGKHQRDEAKSGTLDVIRFGLALLTMFLGLVLLASGLGFAAGSFENSCPQRRQGAGPGSKIRGTSAEHGTDSKVGLLGRVDHVIYAVEEGETRAHCSLLQHDWVQPSPQIDINYGNGNLNPERGQHS